MTIDGKDILTEYGCRLLDGSLEPLLKYPKRKSLKYNNWAESDGIDPDLSEIEFEPRTVKLSFLMNTGSQEEFWLKYKKLVTDLSAPGYRTFEIILGLINKMRLNAGVSYELPIPFNAGKNLSSFELNFVEDDLSISSVSSPYGGIGLHGQYAINGVDFGEFGIGADDDLDDLLKYPALKEPFSDGRTVDLSTITAQHREMKLSLWMLAPNAEEFLNNYWAFFTRWNNTGTQGLYIKAIDGIIQVYYTDCSSYNVEVWNDNQIAVRFILSVIAPVVSWIDAGGTTRSRVVKDKNLGLLADEQGRILVFN